MHVEWDDGSLLSGMLNKEALSQGSGKVMFVTLKLFLHMMYVVLSAHWYVEVYSVQSRLYFGSKGVSPVL